MTTPTDLSEHIDASGFAVVTGVLTHEEVNQLIDELDVVAESDGIERRGGILGIRNLLEVSPAIASLARAPDIRSLAEAVLGQNCFAVRGILFDKTPATNWKVAWHQDLTIAVKKQIEVDGFGPWSEKSGVVSVQPPASVLERMITVRLHLDDCGPDNGPLRVLPGTHSRGRLTAREIEQLREEIPETTVIAQRGAALVMRPLLLHASSAATSPRHRRVVHVDYAADDLPSGLDWHTRA